MILDSLPGKVRLFATSRKEQQRFVKFAIVGAFGTLVHFAILNLLVLAGGLDELIANPIAFGSAVVSNFLFNRFWSFPESRRRALLPQFGQFAAINVVGLVLNQAIFYLSIRFLMPGFALTEVIDYNISLAIAIAIVLFWNFGVNRLTTYRGL